MIGETRGLHTTGFVAKSVNTTLSNDPTKRLSRNENNDSLLVKHVVKIWRYILILTTS